MANTRFNIAPISTDMDVALQEKIDNKTKPLGALGQLEALAKQLGQIQQSLEPEIQKPHMIVFAADHGVVAQNVSPFPQEVTYQMVLNFLSGGAAVNVFCAQHNVPLRIVDVGVKSAFDDHNLLSKRKVANGSRDFTVKSAMTEYEFKAALQVGFDEVDRAKTAGSNLLMFGEMGIGNTTTASCLMSCITDLSSDSCVGPGTGATEEGIARKAKVIEQTKQRIKDDHPRALYQKSVAHLDVQLIAQECGGFEIIAITGAMLRAAERKVAFVVDGFICSVAYLVAQKLDVNVRGFAIFAHESQETAHGALLKYLDVTPLLSMSLRLGEGSGAILALPLIESAALFLKNMASFESAAVSQEKD
jgi:nicotinate-nucleotide--dimethylbenzimidazole phosphoribosyltransferase